MTATRRVSGDVGAAATARVSGQAGSVVSIRVSGNIASAVTRRMTAKSTGGGDPWDEAWGDAWGDAWGAVTTDIGLQDAATRRVSGNISGLLTRRTG